MPAAPAERPTVAVEELTKHYRGGGGVTGVSLEVRPGEVFGFLGPNGAGKSTTIRLLLDLIRPDSGTVRLFGLDVGAGGPQVRRRIGYLPGDLSLYPRMTARQLLLHFADLRGGLPWADVAALVDRFDLELDRPVRALSRGNRQKVGLVQALMGTPELLLLDEPTSGLDPLVQHQVHDVIREAAADGRTVFLSSHVLSEVARVATRVGLIRDGRVVSVERVEDLRGRSVHLAELTLAEGSIRPDWSGVTGVTVAHEDGDTVHLEVGGSLDPLVATLARCRLADLTVREPDLEELFLSFYERRT